MTRLSPMPERFRLERFAFIDALRGLAALAVTCYHVHRYGTLEVPADDLLPDFVQLMVRHGWIGVQVFWVIAGFVAAYSLRNAAVTPAFFGNFALRRVVRLGAPYWTAILSVVAIDFAARHWLRVPSLTDPITWPKLAANVVFLQDVLGYGNISAGTWFVCVDLQFGLLFAVMLWLAQRLSSGAAVGGKAHALALTAVFAPLGLISLFVLNLDARYDAWVIYFFCMPLFGALAWWTLEGRIPRGVFWVSAAVLAAGAAYRWQIESAYQKQKPLEIAVVLIAGSTIYLVGRRGHLGDWLAAGWLQYLGRISYSLYLIHYAASWVVVSLGRRLTGESAVAAVVWLVAAVAASIGAAHLLYVFVEAPSLQLAKRLKARAALGSSSSNTRGTSAAAATTRDP